MSTIPPWSADLPDGTVTSDGGVKGAGQVEVIHERGTNNQHVSALGRFDAGQPNPEPQSADVRRTEAIDTIIASLSPDDAAEVEALFQTPPYLAFNIAVLLDITRGEELARAILAANGWLPESATYAQVDDLLATRYAHDTPDQRAAQMLRGMGLAIAAGEDPYEVIAALTRLGPQRDDFALHIARRADQARDIADPAARGFNPAI